MDESDLAKTAGSPAFFARELCHQGDLSSLAASFSVQTPQGLPGSHDTQETEGPSGGTTLNVPASSSSSTGFGGEPHRTLSSSSKHTYRATAAGEGPSTIRQKPLPPSRQDSAASSSSQQATPTIPPSTSAQSQQAPPITAAIDVWALGVTLYCLLFGRPPFSAPTEFMLYKIIPLEDFEIPERMGKDGKRTGGRWGARRKREREQREREREKEKERERGETGRGAEKIKRRFTNSHPPTLSSVVKAGRQSKGAPSGGEEGGGVGEDGEEDGEDVEEGYEVVEK